MERSIFEMARVLLCCLLVFVSICLQRGMQDQTTARTYEWLRSASLEVSSSDEDEASESESSSPTSSNSRPSLPSSGCASGSRNSADEAASSAHVNQLEHALASLRQELASKDQELASKHQDEKCGYYAGFLPHVPHGRRLCVPVVV